ncbi:MAG: hypothetical protein KA383_12310 [Phycisphaerae bacterium]|jgi:hypothetical protein|nr:hypothetical protein [Phycisphaerae bacterium]HQL55154.1 hypothetical protein [Phycisphaerae bacterium]
MPQVWKWLRAAGLIGGAAVIVQTSACALDAESLLYDVLTTLLEELVAAAASGA